MNYKRFLNLLILLAICFAQKRKGGEMQLKDKDARRFARMI
jgi:hypothetical protein